MEEFREEITREKISEYLVLPYPISVNRYWRKSNNRMYVSGEGLNFKNKVLNSYKFVRKPISYEVKLSITIHPKMNKNGSQSKILIDLDNSLKCILDSLIGIIYIDDCQVKEILVKYGVPVKNGASNVFVENMY